MAQIIPSNWRDIIHANEIQFAEHLHANLPAEWRIIVSMNWSRHKGIIKTSFGEIDFLILSPTGALHVVELKTHWSAAESEDDIFFSYEAGKKPKSIKAQINRNQGAVMEGLRSAGVLGAVSIMPWVVLSRYRVKSSVCGLDEYYIVHRGVSENPFGTFCERVLDVERARLSVGESIKDTYTLVEKLAGVLDLRMSVDQFGESERYYRYLVEDSFDLIDSLWSEDQVFVLDGVAGAGKTQLALRLLLDGDRSYQTTVRVLVTRSVFLVRRVAEVLSTKSSEITEGLFIDSSDSGLIVVGTPESVLRFFESYEAANPGASIPWGVVVIDEAHAVPKSVINQFVQRRSDSYRLAEGMQSGSLGRIFLLMDSAQDGREISKVERLGLDRSVDFVSHVRYGGWNFSVPEYSSDDRSFVDGRRVNIVSLSLDCSFRIPEEHLDFINKLNLREAKVKTRSGIEGALRIVFHDNEDAANHAAVTEFKSCLDQPLVEQSNYALLSLQDRSSQISKDVMSQTSRYSVDLASGELSRRAITETVYGFLGYSRRYVILCGATRDFSVRRLRYALYCGVTRSSEFCTIHISRDCYEALEL